MKINKIDIIKSLHTTFLQEKPQKEHFDKFKLNLYKFLENSDENETEENLKNDLILFLNSIYNQDYYINTKERADLVIHTDKSPKSNVGVIFEIKHPANKTQMITNENINCKGFQQLVLYFLRERINKKNIDIKHLIITNIYDWYIFDATEFEKIFVKTGHATSLVKQFIEWQLGQKTSENTELFYNQIAKPFIDNNIENISFTFFNINNFVTTRHALSLKPDNVLIPLYKILSPFHLLKLAFKNDSNTLNTQFYYELLHIIGLEEQTENGTRLLKRCKQMEPGSLLENTINRINFYNNINEIENIEAYGNNQNEIVFGLALELCIIWLNRILFLKLLESQLIQFNNDDKKYYFLNSEKIKSYSKLDNLFFDVLVIKKENRSEQVKKHYDHIPYLNSSLFEATKLEKKMFIVSTLDNELKLNYFKSTILKDEKGNKMTGEVYSLQYLLDFLGAYNFGSKSEKEFQEDDKILINSSVLGLIFEKINGYKEGAFYTPGYITMYMCQQTIRRAVVEEFNKKYNWNCKYEDNLLELYNKITKISIKEANDVINSITICDPAVGSGHFLVSALNEMIAVKADLDVLTDRQGKLLKDYNIKVENDELVIIDTDGKYFQYNLFNGIETVKNKELIKEKQRVQEAIFHEKQYIIENCLFGVDINHNSVNITRLRLWIELLKNAYYKLIQNENSPYLELQTLPNIDINIKCGNSLIYRFPLNTDLSKILKSIKFNINYFKACVQNYKHAENKELKKGYEKSIEQIKSDFKVQIRRLDPRQVKINRLKDELQDRFLSPKLLQQDYTEEQKMKINEEREKLLNLILQLENEITEELSGIIYQKAFEWRFEFPEVLDSETGEFLGFSVVLGNPPYMILTKNNTKNKLLEKYINNFQSIKHSTSKNIFTLFIENSIALTEKNGFLSFIVPEGLFQTRSYKECVNFINTNGKVETITTFKDFVFENAVTGNLIFLYRNNYFENGIKYIHYSNDKYEVIQKKSNEIIGKINEKNYNKLNKYAKLFKGMVFKDRKEVISSEITETNKDVFLYGNSISKYSINKKYYTNYDNLKIIGGTKIKTNYEKIPRILIRRTGDYLCCAWLNYFAYTESTLYSCYSISEIDTKYLLALLNSKLLTYYLRILFITNKQAFPQILMTDLEEIPIAVDDKNNQNRIIKLIDKILKQKEKNPKAEITELEQEIDTLVYKLYELTNEEIQTIENDTKTK